MGVQRRCDQLALICSAGSWPGQARRGGVQPRHTATARADIRAYGAGNVMLAGWLVLVRHLDGTTMPRFSRNSLFRLALLLSGHGTLTPCTRPAGGPPGRET